jgi:hypothetical protein
VTDGTSHCVRVSSASPISPVMAAVPAKRPGWGEALDVLSDVEHVIEVSRTSTETKQALHIGIAQAVRDANVLESEPNGVKMAPGETLRGPFPLVALSRFSPNILLTCVQDDAHVTDGRVSFVSPLRRRRRITARLRADVLEAYESGQTSRQVARHLFPASITPYRQASRRRLPVTKFIAECDDC